MWDFSNYMVCATPLRGHIQHLWKTVNLLHPLLIRVLLLILERWVESYHLVFTGRMYKNPINSFHVLEQQSKQRTGSAAVITWRRQFHSRRYYGYIWYNSHCSCIYQFFIPQYAVLLLICLSPSTGNKINLTQLAVYSCYNAFSDEKSLENINSTVYLYLHLADLILNLWCGREIYCLPPF